MSEEQRVYGPFHRLHHPTQTDDDARLQAESGEMWGRTTRYGRTPQVKALFGPLPNLTAGIEFTTTTPPDRNGSTYEARWSAIAENPAVQLDGEFAKIEIDVVRVVPSSLARGDAQ